MNNTTQYSTSGNTSNPWIGLDSYHEGQALYGRGREVQNLAMAVFYHRHTVVYGRSGIGKSSLLHAGIFPEARRRGCLPISVRFDHFTSVSYREQLIRFITDAVTAAGGSMADSAPDNGAPQSLWEFFHRYQPQKDGQPLIPLIVIDQFEEIFTLSKNRQSVKTFFDELADLFNDMMPEYLQSKAVQEETKTDSLFAGLNLSMVDERFAQEMQCHIVFVLREDYLSFLERFSQSIPALKQNRYGVMPITYRQAEEIITKPREGLVSLEVADAIIRHIVTEEEVNDDTPVDAAILSLFLSRLYEKKGDAPAISLQLVNEQGDALLEDFYEEIVAPLDVKTVHFLEDTLINADGHRENITIESLYKNSWINRDAVAVIERSHLLRIFSYGDVQRVEFAHDVLCPIVVKRRDQRINRARLRRSRRRAIWSYVIVFAALFAGLEASLFIGEWKAGLDMQKARLAEVEASLIAKGAQKMIEKHDYYGAIRLLMNSMPEDLSNPSPATAKKELVLRRALEYMHYPSEDSCVGKVNFQFTLSDKNTAILSPSKRLVGFNDITGAVVLVDSHTGAIVQCYSTRKVDPYDGVFSDANAYGWKYHVKDGEVIRSYQHHTSRLQMCDISSVDGRCLIIADDTTLLDCFRFCEYTNPFDNDPIFGKTNICFHDFHQSVSNAAYSADCNRIAVLLKDSSCLLYDANTGKAIVNEYAADTARVILQQVKARQFSLYKEDNGSGGVWYDLPIEDSLFMRIPSIREVIVCRPPVEEKLPDIVDIPLYEPTLEEEDAMLSRLDSAELPSELSSFKRSFIADENDTLLEQGTRYHWPMAFNQAKDRVFLMRPKWRGHEVSVVCGVYPATGGVFYEAYLLADVHSIRFSQDDNYVVVNPGEKSENIIYLPPLLKLLEECGPLFFQWEMSGEERYQTYIHMND